MKIRMGVWMRMALCRFRFNKRIPEASTIINFDLTKHLEKLGQTPQMLDLQNGKWTPKIKRVRCQRSI